MSVTPPDIEKQPLELDLPPTLPPVPLSAALPLVAPDAPSVCEYDDPHPPRRHRYLPWRVRWGHVRRLVLCGLLLFFLTRPLKYASIGRAVLNGTSWFTRLLMPSEPVVNPLLAWGQGLSSASLLADLTNSIPSANSDPTSYSVEYRSRDPRQGWDAVGRRTIWQTDKDATAVNGGGVKRWRGGIAQKEGWEWVFLTDEAASIWVKQRLAGTRLETVWDNLPSGILRADFLRYLLLAIHGGIYTDTDTTPLRPPSAWGHGADLWRDGEGWLERADILRLASFSEAGAERDAEVDRILGRPAVIVGIEADVGDMQDWQAGWARPLQIAQWSMALAPFHPIALSALLRVLRNTATAIDFAQAHHAQYLAAYTDPDPTPEVAAEARRLGRMNVLSEPKDGGPLGVIEWTGPGVWTEAVLEYLERRYGVKGEDLKGLKRPLRVGDVVLLPVTGFSPGVGNFGAGELWDEQAMVEHRFRGSWKI